MNTERNVERVRLIVPPAEWVVSDLVVDLLKTNKILKAKGFDSPSAAIAEKYMEIRHELLIKNGLFPGIIIDQDFVAKALFLCVEDSEEKDTWERIKNEALTPLLKYVGKKGNNGSAIQYSSDIIKRVDCMDNIATTVRKIDRDAQLLKEENEENGLSNKTFAGILSNRFRSSQLVAGFTFDNLVDFYDAILVSRDDSAVELKGMLYLENGLINEDVLDILLILLSVGDRSDERIAALKRQLAASVTSMAMEVGSVLEDRGKTKKLDEKEVEKKRPIVLRLIDHLGGSWNNKKTKVKKNA